ncbi:MAG: hydrolase [Pirellulales bacterium]
MKEAHAEGAVRSPELMSRDDTALLVVDVQEKLVRLLPDHERLIWNVGRLVRAAQLLGLPVLGTEQYPQGLGGTVAELATLLGSCEAKTAFSSASCQGISTQLADRGVSRVCLAGMEAHVCIQQSAYDLLAAGYRVYLPVDALGSRYAIDYQTALRRLESAGAVLTTVEAAMFEWCQDSAAPQFKDISKLVRETGPTS